MNADKMDLLLGIDIMEKELSKNHSPASNIMSICTEVRKQVTELQENREKARAEGRDEEKKTLDEREKDIRESAVDDMREELVEVREMLNALLGYDSRYEPKELAKKKEQVRKLKELINKRWHKDSKGQLEEADIDEIFPECKDVNGREMENNRLYSLMSNSKDELRAVGQDEADSVQHE